MDIREFLEARLAEDEATARAAEALDTNWPFWIDVDDEADYRAATEFRTRLGPARVLRDVEAKRRIIAAYDWALAHPHDDEETGYWVAKGGRSALLDTLHVLAMAWSDHPDYDTSWSPTS